jgi:hypothetical protein
MSVFPMVGSRIILAVCQLPLSDPPMWRCTLRSENGTVIRTWETENEQCSLRLTSSRFGRVGRHLIHAVEFVETPSDPGAAT